MNAFYKTHKSGFQLFVCERCGILALDKVARMSFTKDSNKSLKNQAHPVMLWHL